MSDFASGYILDKQRKIGLLYSEEQKCYQLQFDNSGISEADHNYYAARVVRREEGVTKTTINLFPDTMETLVELYFDKLCLDDGDDIEGTTIVSYTVHREKRP